MRLAKHENIAVTAYSSFGPCSFKEFTSDGHATARNMVPLMEEPVIVEIAKRVGKQPSQVLLRWATQDGLAVIPKTSRKEVMPVNLDCTGWDISQEDMDKISALDKGIRFNEPTNVSRPVLAVRFSDCIPVTPWTNCGVYSTLTPRVCGCGAKGERMRQGKDYVSSGLLGNFPIIINPVTQVFSITYHPQLAC